MKLAAIDIGSNTIRLLVARMEQGIVMPIRHERVVTRLASGLHASGLIAHGPLEQTVEAIRSFAAMARADGADAIKAVATSALRESENGPEAIRYASREAGLTIEVIDGLDEAEITSMGVLQGFSCMPNALIFDIGGGSTEVISIADGNITMSETVPIGVVKLMEGTIKSDPPSDQDSMALDRAIGEAIASLRADFEGFVAPGAILIGTAGTATTLASLDLGLEKYDWTRVQGHVLHHAKLLETQSRLFALSQGKRKELKGMEPERADLIIAGIRLTIRVMETFGFDSMTVSDHGLLEGLIVKLSMEVMG